MNNKLKEYYNQKQDYGINSLRRKKINALVAQEIKQGHKKILDVGCAGGYVSGQWKSNNNYIVGLDIAAQSIHKARHILDAVFLFNLEEQDWPKEIAETKFDIILCAEILEHLFAPHDFLERLKKILTDDGIIIITTPNFLVWNNRARMMLGRYGNKEIFYDQSHIHLFSHNSLFELLKRVGLKTIKQDNLWYPNYLERFAKFLPSNLFVYQTIIKASFL